jgi:hypothetical protein
MTLSGGHLTLSWRLIRLAASMVSAAFGSFLGKSKDMRLKIDNGAAIESGSLALSAIDAITARSDAIDLRASGPVAIDGRHLRLG